MNPGASKIFFGKKAEAPGHAASRRKQKATSRAPIAGQKPDENTITNAEGTPSERTLKATELECRARLWVDENPDAWVFMVTLALHETRSQRRFGVKWLIEEARRKDFADVKGKRMRLSNTLAPAFARILVEEHPECRTFVVLKHSILDEVAR